MSYGSKQWQDWVLDEDESLPLIEHAYKKGINTWDTVSGPLPVHLETELIYNRRMSIPTVDPKKLLAKLWRSTTSLVTAS